MHGTEVHGSMQDLDIGVVGRTGDAGLQGSSGCAQGAAWRVRARRAGLLLGRPLHRAAARRCGRSASWPFLRPNPAAHAGSMPPPIPPVCAPGAARRPQLPTHKSRPRCAITLWSRSGPFVACSASAAAPAPLPGLAAACTLHAPADQEEPGAPGQAGQPCPRAPCLTANDLPGVSTAAHGLILRPPQTLRRQPQRLARRLSACGA